MAASGFAATATLASAPQPRAGPSLPLERYTGTYVDSTYGSFDITLSGGTLRARFRNLDVGELEPVQGEVFRSKPTPSEEAPLSMTFVIGAAGAVTGLKAYGITFDLVRK